MTRRRFWVYFLLFLFNMIAYTDRVNMSVAGKPIADELHLSPVALGYLFSSFLWICIICLLPAGALTDRLGTRRAVGRAVALWSVFQMLSGLAPTMMTLLFARLGLGIFWAETAP